MNAILFDLLIPIATGATGLAVGWMFARSYIQKATNLAVEPAQQTSTENQTVSVTPDIEPAASISTQDNDAPLSREQVQQILKEVGDVTQTVRTDVGRHTVQMRRINSGLAGELHASADMLSSTIEKLIQSNNSLEARLDNAESKLKEQSEVIASQMEEALTDSLTGLSNRRVFDKTIKNRYEKYIESRLPTSLLLVDIDNFKHFNDTYGHQVGDEVLCQIGSSFNELFDTTNAIPTRYGGEEFAVILPDTKMRDAKVAAAKVLGKFQKVSVHHQDQQLSVTGSIGVAELNSKDDLVSFIQRTDQSLYAAKEAGRNCIFWNDGEQELPLSQAEVAEIESDSKTPTAKVLADKNGSPNADTKSTDPTQKQDEYQSERTEFINDLERRVSASKRTREPISVIMLAVDQLEQISGSHGEQAVQLVKNVMSQLLSAVLRDSDHVSQLDYSRYGIILPTADIGEASLIAERLRNAVSKVSLKTETGSLLFTISTGVTQSFPLDDRSKLLNRASAGLKSSVISGGNQVTVMTQDPIEMAEEFPVA